MVQLGLLVGLDLELLKKGILLALFLIARTVLLISMTTIVAPAENFVPPTAPHTLMLSYKLVLLIFAHHHLFLVILLHLPLDIKFHIHFRLLYSLLLHLLLIHLSVFLKQLHVHASSLYLLLHFMFLVFTLSLSWHRHAI